jgi:hypothetical protein
MKIPKPFRIVTSTLYARFNGNKTDEEVKNYIQYLRTKGVDVFTPVNESKEATPAKVLLSQGRGKILWEVLDSALEYKGIDLTQPHGKMANNLLGCAASVNNVEFIEEWHRRGLPLQDPSWSASPLSVAINAGHTPAVKCLSDFGADWLGNYGAHMTKSSYQHGRGWVSQTLEIKNTTAWAQAVASPVAEILKIALSKNDTPTEKDWQAKVFFQDENGFKKMPLSSLVGELLGSDYSKSFVPSPEPAPTSGQGSRWYHYKPIDLYQEAWWKTWRLSGLMDHFKATAAGQDIKWDRVYDGGVTPNHVYRALAVGVDKPVTLDALKQCVKAIAERKNKNELLSHLTAARAKALWDESGPLFPELRSKKVQIGYSSSSQMLIYPSVVLRNLRIPSLWKDGANSEVFARQFWQTLKDRHEGKRQDPNDARRDRYGLPSEFDVSASKVKRQAAYKALDALAQVKSIQLELPALLKAMVEAQTEYVEKGKGGRYLLKHSGNHLLEIAIPILWGIERGLLNPKDTHEFILSVQDTVKDYKKAESAEWMAQIERFRLTQKVATKVDIPKPNFDGAL